MDENTGTITIAPEVLVDIVRLTTAGVPGVARLSADEPSPVNRFFRGSKMAPGIQVGVEDGAVTVDVYVVAEPDAQMMKLGQDLQREIGRAVEEVAGMPIRAVNVHIADVADRFEREG
jgi:uncharacterized alkaline shock family protein YloU